ncbi:MAG: hypothetical protein ACOCRX_08390 [Candidatus Woesearchaeota archaeon]
MSKEKTYTNSDIGKMCFAGGFVLGVIFEVLKSFVKWYFLLPVVAILLFIAFQIINKIYKEDKNE